MPLPNPQGGPARSTDPRVAEAVERALNAADGEELQALLDAEIARLGAESDDPRARIRLALERLQDDLFHRERRLRAETDEGRRRAVRLRMARELLAGDDEATHTARWERESPYRGLWPFREDQSEVFYGRSRLTAELTGHIAACLDGAGMAVVTGASGAGKSSLVRAGLIPAIARGRLPVAGSEDWPVLTLTPGPAPVDELAARLAEVTGADVGSIRNTLASRPGDAYLYARQAVFSHTDGMPPERRDRVRANGRLLVCCDQFEELFTLTRDAAARNAFLQALFAIASGGEAEGSGLVVIGVRGDFIDRCASVPALVPVLRSHSFVVGPPEAEELRQVITGPAAAARLHLDDGLADDILADLRAAAGGGGFTAGALPLLSQTMLSLWQRRDGDRLTRHGYTEIGGVGRAIEVGAEQIHQRLSPHQRELSARLFRELTVIDRHGEAARRRIRRSALLAEAPGIAPVLEAFTAGRLIVMVGDTVEIAHDVLLRSWRRLETWLQADRAHRALLTEVADDAADWARRDRDASFLYRGAKFEAAERARGAWVAAPDTFPELDTVVEEFLDASRRAESNRARARRAVTAVLAVLLAASLTAAGVAFNLNRVAEAANTELTAERNRLLAQDLAEASADNAGVDGDLSRLLAAAAWRIDPDDSYEDTMARALDDPVDYTAEPHVDDVDRIAFAPGGEALVSGSEGELVLWDVPGRAEAARVEGFAAEALAFSADGTELAVDTGDGVHLLDPADLSERTVVQLPANATGFAYGPTGLLVAVESSVIAIDPASHDRSTGPSWGIGDIGSLAFSADLGSYLVGTDDGVWSATGLDAEPERIWTGSDERRFSDGGRYMVEWSTAAVTLIDLELGLPVRTMRATGPIADAAVDAEGSIIALAVGSEVRYIRTEDMTDIAAFDTGYADARDFDVRVDAEGAKIAVTGPAGTEVRRFDGDGLVGEPLFDEPELPGRLVRFHPDGESLMIVDAGSHRRFDLDTAAELDVPWDTEDWIAHVSFSPDGRWITVIDGENHSEGTTVRLDLDSHATILDAETGEARLRIEPVNGETAMFGQDTVAYSPDGRSVAAIDEESIRIWDLAEGTMTAETAGDFSAVSALRYGPEGTRLLALGDDTPMVWDLDADEVRAMDAPPSDAWSFFDLGGRATFGPGGRHVVRTSELDRAVEVWDTVTGAHLLSLTMTGGSYMQLHVPDHEAILALDSDGTLFRQDLGFLAAPYETLCSRTDRTLTEDEWAEYLPGLALGSVEICP